MDFLVYHRDRVGSMPLRLELLTEHLDYMDRFETTMVARGPTFIEDGTLTGSVHLLGLSDPRAARAFAFDEPCYQAGVYRDVLVRRWHNTLGRTMWDSPGSRSGYFVIGFTRQPRSQDPRTPALPFIAFGPLLSDDGRDLLGLAAILEARDAQAASAALASWPLDGVEVHRWRAGGRHA